MSNDNELIEWVTKNLKGLKIEDETISEYIAGIIEEIEDEEECKEAIEGFLTEATEEPIDNFMENLMKYSNELKEQNIKNQEEERKRIKEEAIKKEAEALNVSSVKQVEEKKELSKEERKMRQNLLEKYAFNLDKINLNENGEEEIEYVDHNQSNEGDSSIIPKNINVDIVKEAERKKRIIAKKKHNEKVENDKKLLERQKLAKEKEKRRTMKKEKRRL